MTKHTGRDLVWHHALRQANNEESFYLDDIADIDEINLSERTIRDTLNTLADSGWLEKESPRAHEWQPGPKISNKEGRTPDEDASNSFDAMSIEHIEDLTDFEKGEVYFGTVCRFSEYGDGIIEIPTSHINVGPIDNSAKNETVRFRFVGGSYGLCLDEQYTHSDYTVPGAESSNNSD